MAPPVAPGPLRKEERRVDPMLEGLAVTFSEMCLGLADEKLSEEQLKAHWADLKKAAASKENRSDNFKASAGAPSIVIPGVVDDGSSAVASQPHGKPPRLEDAQSSHRSHGSPRSFEYLTPEPTPRTPPGYGSLGARTVHVQRPGSAPTAPIGQPRSLAGKDFSVCKRTGTVIPCIPPMPSTALRADGTEKHFLTPPPCTVGAENLGGVATAQGLPLAPPLPRRPLSAAAPPLPRRPHSAAAANAFSARRSLSKDVVRRSSEPSAAEICYPPNVLSAARHGRYTEVESALLAGFMPNYADTHGNTVFHIACQNGRRRIAKLAIKYGCDMNAQNMKGNTGLHFLFAYGYPDIAEYFIKKGADEFIINTVGKTAREGIK